MATNNLNLTTLYGTNLTGILNPTGEPGSAAWQPTPILNAASADLTNPNNLLQPALNGTIDWSQVGENMASTQTGVPNIPQKPTVNIANNASITEKARITAQKISQEYGREDSFSIGTVYLSIPPSQISISEEKHNFRYKTLRNGSDTITSSGRSTLRIDLDILFNGIDDINNKLRPLIAQFKCTPFLPISNDYVRSVVEPESSSLTNDNEPSDEAETDSEENAVNQLNSLSSSKTASINSLMANVSSLQAMGALSGSQVAQANTVINGWYANGNSGALLADPIAAMNTVTSPSTGATSLNFKQYVSSLIETGGNKIDNDQLGDLAPALNNLDAISSNIDNISQSMGNMVSDSVSQRNTNRQIVGVLSQMTIATVPGYPETLSARISMYVFNYDPYSYDFSFIQGYNPKSYTPDITQCELFVDWYANRFLSVLNQGDSLGVYRADDSLYFNYITSMGYDNLITGGVPNIQSASISMDPKTIVTGMSVTMRNVIKFLPVLSGARPTCQYMGAYNTTVQININSTNRGKVTKIRKMLDVMARLSRKSNRIGRYNVFQVSNYLTSLCGFKYFAVDTFSIDTVPGSPGLYAISMELSQAKLGQENLQQLDRILTTDQDSVLAAAKFILTSAQNYAQDTSPNHVNTASLAKWYAFVWGTEGGGTGITPYASTLAQCIRLALSGDINGYYPDYGNSATCKAEISKINGGSTSINYGGTAIPTNVRTYAGKGTAQSGGSTTSGGYSQIPGNENVQNYINNLFTAFNSSSGTASFPNGQQMNWDSEFLFCAYALAAGDYTNIAALLDPQSTGAPDLQSAVTESAIATKGKVTNIVDPTCYPDLALPTYSQITNGNLFKLTYADLGILTPNVSQSTQPAQIDYVAVEPDIFYSKKSIQTITDNLGTPSMNVGLANFYTMSQNSLLSTASPINASVWEDKIRKAYAYNDTSYGVKISQSTDLISQAKGVTRTSTGASTPNANNLTNSPSSLSNSTTSMIDGKPCTVTQVLDANTVLVQGNGTGAASTQYAIRIIDYAPAPDGNSQANVNALNAAFPGAGNVPQLATSPNMNIAKSVLIGVTIIPKIVNVPVTYQYGYNILNASVTINGQSALTIMTNAGMQMDSSSNITQNDVTNSASSTVPQQASDTEIQSIFGELAFMLNKNTKNPVIKTVPSTSTPGSSLGSSSTVSNGSIETQSVSVQGTQGDVSSPRFVYPGWIAPLQQDNLNNNSNYNRFDRYSQAYISEITRRIRYQNKDDMLRMVKAFPTFKFYFVEENRMEFVPLPSFIKSEIRSLDEIYSYDAIMSIDINKNRKEAADTAVIKILNTTGNLDRSRFGLHDPGSNETQSSHLRSQNPNDMNTINESQPIDEFILKAGTRIRIKMGYGSDPTFLDNVFTGQISEVNMGDVITIVAQGYGTELMKPLTGWGSRKYQDYSIYKVVNDIIQRPEIIHFGYAELNPIINQSLRILNRRLVPNTGTLNGDVYTKYGGPGLWRYFGGIEWLLERTANQAANNIFSPEVTQIQEEFNGGRWEFQMENRTAWDIIQEITRRMPGYIAQVLPFDNRATLYFGPTDHFYSYSENIKALVGETRSGTEDQQGQVDNAVANGTLTQLSNAEISSYVSQVNSLVNQAASAEGWVVGQATSTQSVQLRLNTAPDAAWILQQTEIWLGGQDGQQNNIAIIDSFRRMAESNVSGSSSVLTAGPISITPGASVQIFNQTTISANNPIYQDSTGSITDANTYIANMSPSLKVPANMKLARGYHYYDSLRNIVSNNIIASDENMYNKVDVVTANRGNWFGLDFLPRTPNGYDIISAQANDMIWDEKIKTKVCNEPNAHTTQVAWCYAMGNLTLGMKEMYQGNLVILGDATVKPNDVIFVNDYYTDMNGPFEVREVNHHFSYETGFVTTIVPDLIVHTNNAMAMASDTVAGGWYDDVANGLLWGHGIKQPAVNNITGGSLLGATQNGVSTPALNANAVTPKSTSSQGQISNGSSYSGMFANRPPNIRAGTAPNSASTILNATIGSGNTLPTENNTNTTNPASIQGVVAWTLGKTGAPEWTKEVVSALQFATGGYTWERREPINFIPLIFSNRPYIAGIEGWRRSDWWEATRTKIARYVYSYEQAAGYLSKLATSVHTQLADGTGANI